MQEGLDDNRGLSQTMVFSTNHPVHALQDKSKGAEVTLRERGLWPTNGRRPDGFKFRPECPTSQDRKRCNPGHNNW